MQSSRRQKYCTYLFLGALFARPLPAVETRVDSFPPIARTWSISDGLPQNSIHALAQSQDGYIWIGSPSGLARFDGVQFKIFDRQNTPELKSDKITAIHPSPDKKIWIGTRGGGLNSYDQGKWLSWSTQNGLSHENINALIGDWQGNLWIGTDYGLNRFGPDGFKVYTTQDGLHSNLITSLAIDPAGSIWIGTLGGGLARFHNGAIQNYNRRNGLANTDIFAITADRPGAIWAGTMEGLYRIDPGRALARYISGTNHTPITSMVEDSAGMLWIGTMAGGLLQWAGGKAMPASLYRETDDVHVRVLLKDRDGHLWVGTESQGLLQFKPSGFRNITRKEGLPENAVSAAIQDRDGSFWLGTPNHGVGKMKAGRITALLNRNSGLVSNTILSLLQEDGGAMWIGTNAGISIRRNGKFENLTSANGLSSNTITSLLQDRFGMIWIGTDKGLNLYAHGRLRELPPAKSMSQESINTLLQGRAGIIYIGGKKGVWEIDGNTCRKLTAPDPAMDNEAIALHEDGEGTLWIGTNGNGLVRWRENSSIALTTADGLPDNHILSIAEDDAGILWMSSYHGVFSAARTALNGYAENKASPLPITWYDESEGMISGQCAGGGRTGICKANDGLLYFPTNMGLSILDPRIVSSGREPVPVIIEQVRADERIFEPVEGWSFYGHVTTLEFHFTAIDFSAPDKLRFQFQLDGFDPDYRTVFPGQKRTAVYRDLEPGSYLFHVRAIDNRGFLSSQEAAIRVEIPSSKRVLTLLLLIAASILSVWSFRIFIRRRRKPDMVMTKYATSALHPERAREIVPRLVALMEKERLFLNPDLTLKELAQRLKIHYNHLSQIIHEEFGQSYNDYVNNYRIGEAQKRLTATGKNEATISQIMYEVGFYSKSVFNTAFKKLTGTTPSEYKKKH